MHLMRAVLLGLCAVTGCYDASFHDCAIRCTADTGCPEGFTCGPESVCRVKGALDACPALNDASIDAPYTQAECNYMEPNDALFVTAMQVTAGDMGPAAICAPAIGQSEDHDFYKFTVASAAVTVAIQFQNRPGGDLDIRLWKISATLATLVSQSSSFGNGETIACPGSAPTCPALTVGADYALEVFPAAAGSVNAYTFTVSP